MGFPIDQSKLKRNRIMRTKTKLTDLRLNQNMSCRASYITEILPNGSWKGKTCFLIGGGPSLAGFDFSPLKNELTIGVNKAFTIYPTTINYAMDIRLNNVLSGQKSGNERKWEALRQQWLAYTGIKLFMRRSVKLKFDKSVHVIKNLNAKKLCFDLKQGIWGGNNSGFGALMLAVGLGATRIGLLGYDLKVKVQKGKKLKTHWHDGYSFNGSSDSFQRKLDKFRMCFEEFAGAIAKQGIKVVNLNSDSALTCFPKESLETLLIPPPLEEFEFIGTK